jgi:hypothetical protein
LNRPLRTLQLFSSRSIVLSFFRSIMLRMGGAGPHLLIYSFTHLRFFFVLWSFPSVCGPRSSFSCFLILVFKCPATVPNSGQERVRSLIQVCYIRARSHTRPLLSQSHGQLQCPIPWSDHGGNNNGPCPPLPGRT